MSNVVRTFASSSTPVPTPAFEKMRSSGAALSLASIHASTAARSVTSTTVAWTVAPHTRHRAATASSRAASRPQMKSVSPRRAQARASASPMPELAPVIKVFM